MEVMFWNYNYKKYHIVDHKSYFAVNKIVKAKQIKGTKGDWDFWIFDLVKNSDGDDI